MRGRFAIIVLGLVGLCGPTRSAAALAATPVISPAGGVYASARSVTITCASPTPVIRYTTDGSRPTAGSAPYTGAFQVPSTAVVRAVATAPGLSESLVATAVFVVESGGTKIGPDHTVVLDGQGKLLSWLPQGNAYGEVIRRVWDNFVNAMPTSGGNPYWYLYSFMGDTLAPATNWPSAPGGQMGMLADAAIVSFPYTGNTALMNTVKAGLQFHLAHGQTPMTGAWQGVPYNEANPGSTTYSGASGGGWSPGVGDGANNLEPDKVAELGLGYLWFYMYDPTLTTFRDAAIRCADALAANRVTNTSRQVSPWPFRVRQSDNSIPTSAAGERFCGNVSPYIRLFDTLIRLGLGNTTSYQTARDAVWTWAASHPIPNNDWANYFEDQAWSTTFGENQNQLNPGNFARLLLEQPGLSVDSLAWAQGMATWIEANFAEPPVYGALTINEQYWYMHPMGSHTARFGAANALLHAATADPSYKEKAFRALNWATYMNRADGWSLDGYPLPNQIWFTDGFGDTVRHMAVAMAAVPEWAPAGEDHLLASTSVVQAVTYGKDVVSYRTYDAAAREVLRLSFTPAQVTAGSVSLPQRADLAAEGWTWDGAAGVLRIRHDGAGQVVVSAGPSPLFILPSPATTAPRGSLQFAASGGSGTGYAWTLATNASGGGIGTATGAYTAGPTGGVTDVVRVTDSLANQATRTVTVTAATPSLTISPATASAAPGGAVQFAASGGSGTGYAWTLATNASGGGIGTATGAYTAGPTGGVTDVVRVTDSLGDVATAAVTVRSEAGPQMIVTTGCGCSSGRAGLEVLGGLALVLLRGARRKETQR